MKLLSYLKPITFCCFAVLLMQPIHTLHASPSKLLELSDDSSEPTYTIKFNDIEVTEFIDYVGQISGKNFIYDQSQMGFRISIISEEPATSSEILSMLVQILKLNQFTISEEGKNLLIYRSSEDSGVKYLPKVVSKELNNEHRASSGLMTRVFKIKYANPSEVARIIASIATDPDNVVVHIDTRHVIVVDLVEKIEHIADLITSIDQIGSLVEVEVYKVKHSNISALKSYAEKIMAPISQAITGGTGVVSSDQAQSVDDTGPTLAGLSLIPNVSANALFIIGSRTLIDKTLSILKIIDVPSELEIIAKSRNQQTNKHSTDPAEILDRQINPEFYIYKLQYHRGDQIVQSLKEIADAMISSSDSLDPKLVFAFQTMQWISTTNSLIFSGDDASIIKLKNLIASLDTPVKQVFLEMLILDTSIGNALNFGVDLGANFTWTDKNISGSIGNIGSPGSTLNSSISDSHEARVASAPTALSQGFSMGVIGHALALNGNLYHTIGSMVRALQSDADTNVVMNPKIITEDNVTADFFVGSKTRVKTGIVDNSGSNNVTSSNFELLDIGTTIKVTPTISHDELITLVLEQEISTSLDASGASDSTALVPLTTTSRTSARMHVPDKKFLIIAGMIDETKKNAKTAIPCLGAIPVLGRAFSYEDGTDTKRNLLIFIRPTIIRTPEEARILTQRHKDIVQNSHSIPGRVQDDLGFFDEDDEF